ncbi:hypothetical protein EYF80_003637 [Liparis tanakae]|uniref:Uncharacterized protein n=1 Tax=Liparis tanakae TaxID=230148 RepID=A0A4Z2J809_9TELE|nr:hypothetical protein EYF80_003637 [Liparis tanakae]
MERSHVDSQHWGSLALFFQPPQTGGHWRCSSSPHRPPLFSSMHSILIAKQCTRGECVLQGLSPRYELASLLVVQAFMSQGGLNQRMGLKDD